MVKAGLPDSERLMNSPDDPICLSLKAAQRGSLAFPVNRRQSCESLMLSPMPHGLSTFAEVAVPINVHGTFTYAIPESMRDDVRLGSRVEVPWGRSATTGFVTALVDRSRAHV